MEIELIKYCGGHYAYNFDEEWHEAYERIQEGETIIAFGELDEILPYNLIPEITVEDLYVKPPLVRKFPVEWYSIYNGNELPLIIQYVTFDFTTGEYRPPKLMLW